MHSATVGFGLGFFVALQLGPMSLFLIRTTLRGGLGPGVAVGAGIAAVDGLYAAAGAAHTTGEAVLLVAGVAVGSLTWVTMLAGGIALTRRAMGQRVLRAADFLAGLGMVTFGGALLYASGHDR